MEKVGRNGPGRGGSKRKVFTGALGGFDGESGGAKKKGKWSNRKKRELTRKELKKGKIIRREQS